MKPVSESDAIRQQAILSSLAGFPFLLVFAFVWITAGSLSYLVPHAVAPWIYLFMGIPATPIAITLERRLGYVRAAEPDPLLPLALQILFVQVVAFPAILLVWNATPQYVPVAFAAVVGAHLLPLQWIYRTRLYGVLGVVVAVGRTYSRSSFVRTRCTTRVFSWAGACWSEHSSRVRTPELRGTNHSKPPNKAMQLTALHAANDRRAVR